MSGWGTTPWGISAFGTGATSLGGGLVLSNINPPSGLTIQESAPVTFDLTSTASLIQAVISAEYADAGVVELVYDSTSGLTPYYRNASDSVTPITNGFHFSILRTPTWPGELVRIRVYATDSTGDMLIATLGWSVEAQAVVVTATTASRPSQSTSFDPLGFGVKRPFRRVSTNDFDSASGPDLVRACVGQILGTGIGEVPWRPSFGTTLSQLRHRQNSLALPELARLSIEEALQRWEPRVTISALTAEPISRGTENQILLSLTYQIVNATPKTVQILV